MGENEVVSVIRISGAYGAISGNLLLMGHSAESPNVRSLRKIRRQLLGRRKAGGERLAGRELARNWRKTGKELEKKLK